MNPPFPDGCLEGLVVRPIHLDEQERWRALMDAHHYLGFNHLIGSYLCYVAELGGEWVGLLCWSFAAFKSRHRDRWIGWNPHQREARLKHIVNNARFLILPDVRIKNLASKVLSLNIKRLSGDWEHAHGVPVVLAETFVDHSRFRGTCYTAAGWIPIGQTRGFGKKAGTYVFHGQAKTLFVKPLCRDAAAILSAPFEHPRLYSRKEGATMIDINRLPLKGEGGLIDFLATIPEARKARGIRYKSVTLLALSVCACLSGALSYEDIARWAKSLSSDILRLFGCRQGKAPNEATLRRFLQKQDADAIDLKAGQWLAGIGKLHGPRDIAIDGKTLCGSHDGEKKAVHLLSAVLQKEGVVIAQRAVPSKTNEIPEVKPLLEPLDIEGSVVTLDALHTHRETARYIVEDKKADYVLVAKDNQSLIKKDILDLDEGFFSPSAHGNQQGTRSH
ncbi:MAG: ISAs1 family transposase [Pseudomonadota bacterium]